MCSNVKVLSVKSAHDISELNSCSINAISLMYCIKCILSFKSPIVFFQPIQTALMLLSSHHLAAGGR